MVYRNFIVSMDNTGKLLRQISAADIDKLPKKSGNLDNNLIIKTKYSALNRIDALISMGKYSAKYPVCPGIDTVGEVVFSSDKAFNEGDAVIVSGYGLGICYAGGFGEYIAAPSSWALNVPVGIPLKTAATIGTPGITVAMGVANIMSLTSKKKLAITGAEEDLGSIALAIFSHLGYKITAFICDDSSKDFVEKMNVSEIKTLAKIDTENFDIVFDSLGGEAITHLIEHLSPHGVCVTGGIYEDNSLEINLLPFISQGISIMGVDGMNANPKIKREMWQFISSEALSPYFDWLSTEISLDELENYLPLVLSRKIKGRVVVNLEA